MQRGDVIPEAEVDHEQGRTVQPISKDREVAFAVRCEESELAAPEEELSKPFSCMADGAIAIVEKFPPRGYQVTVRIPPGAKSRCAKAAALLHCRQKRGIVFLGTEADRIAMLDRSTITSEKWRSDPRVFELYEGNVFNGGKIIHAKKLDLI